MYKSQERVQEIMSKNQKAKGKVIRLSIAGQKSGKHEILNMDAGAAAVKKRKSPVVAKDSNPDTV